MKELTLRVVEGVGRQARLDRPTFDPELRAGLAIVGGMFPPTVTSDLIDFMRVSYAGPPLETLIGGRNIRCEECVFEGYEGHPLKASVFRHERASGQRPGVLFVHSGGLMFGDRFSGLDRMIDFVEQLGVVLVSIEYRLAPEYRDPYPREDVYAALEWMASHAESLGVRLDRLLIAGASAGGVWRPVQPWRRAIGAVPACAVSCLTTRCSTTAASQNPPVSSMASASGIA